MESKEFERIMDFAIGEEIEARDFYKEVAQTTSDKSLRVIFEELAQEEEEHRLTLESLKTKQIQKFTFRGVADYKIAETVDTPKLSMNMKPADAIALAMKKEEESMKMYEGLAKAATEEEELHLFMNLAKMEQGRKAKMEELYTQTAFGEVW